MQRVWLFAIAVLGCGGTVEGKRERVGGPASRSEPAGDESVVVSEPAGEEAALASAPPDGEGSASNVARPTSADAGTWISHGDGGLLGDAPGTDAYGLCPEPTESDSLPRLTTWSPRSSDSGLPAEDALALARAAVVGRWYGVVTTEWVPAYPVQMEFSAEGGYSSSCVPRNQCCSALYWGTDTDSELKRLRIDLVQSDGTFAGQIDMVWCYEETGCYVGWSGGLSGLDYDASGNRMRFDITNVEACCPVHVELERL